MGQDNQYKQFYRIPTTVVENARTLAINRWGPFGQAWVTFEFFQTINQRNICHVGCGIEGGPHNNEYGRGRTFEAAFQAATVNGH